jgi:hypothetical protein
MKGGRVWKNGANSLDAQAARLITTRCILPPMTPRVN